MTVVEEVREACAWVAERARSVRIDDEAIEGFARSLAIGEADLTPDPELSILSGAREHRAAFALCLDAINFGSGWWPEIHKRPERSGFATMALGLRERFVAHGPWPAAELCAISARDLAGPLGQDPGHELMALYAGSLRDLGTHVAREHDGSFAAVADAAGGSAVALVETLVRWDCFADVSTYAERNVPFYKRAQIAAADLHHAAIAHFGDLGRLTLFADNLVPHVLRVDGILVYEPALLARIDAGELLEHGSPEEVEIRACAVEAVERLSRSRPELSPQTLDHLLWNRGRDARYKAEPRHRARTTAY